MGGSGDSLPGTVHPITHIGLRSITSDLLVGVIAKFSLPSFLSLPHALVQAS